MIRKPVRAQVRSASGTWAFQAALDRRGLGPVAGVDEAGRGACAGPLVVAAAVLRTGDAARFTGLTDSKLLTAAARDRMYDLVLERALDHAVVVVPAEEVDALGVHVANVEGMRRAVARLGTHPGYVLTDGFPVPGLTAPNAPLVKGDRVAACVAAASVLAKVTRDRIMAEVHEELPVYGFDVHKGYGTAAHTAALLEHGPSGQHRWSYANVAAAAARLGLEPPPHRVARGVPTAGVVQNGGPPQTGGGRPATRRGADR
ncbi:MULTISPECIES: ribonuclease HII [Actinosynnema]|uniref:ribonuclease HII n=1 Tax=Actinosynnema TaxID=40566 RepID=UPI0033712A64|nr:RNase HII [Actinosynnema pretiosum]